MRNIRKAILFFHQNMAAGTTLTLLYSSVRLYVQTETAAREVTVKKKRLQCLLTDGVILHMSLRRSIFTPQLSTCWLIPSMLSTESSRVTC